MEVNIDSPYFGVNRRLQKMLRNELEYLEMIFGRITACDVVLNKTCHDQQENYEVFVRLQRLHHSYCVRQQAPTFERAIVEVVDDLVQQLKAG